MTRRVTRDGGHAPNAFGIQQEMVVRVGDGQRANPLTIREEVGPRLPLVDEAAGDAIAVHDTSFRETGAHIAHFLPVLTVFPLHHKNQHPCLLTSRQTRPSSLSATSCH